MGWTCDFRIALLVLFLGQSSLRSTDGAASGPQSNSNERVERSSSRCTDCEVNGKTYNGHSRFTYEDGCNKFQCTCHCNGSYDCPAEFTMSICPKNGGSSISSSSSSPSPPSAAASARRENEGSFRGSSSSSASSSSSSSSSMIRNHNRRGSLGCRNCVVQGKEYKGHSYFSYVDGCTKYHNCVCRCDGSWNCPSTRSVSICNDQKKEGREHVRENDVKRESTEPTVSATNNTEGGQDVGLSQNARRITIADESRVPQRCLSCFAGGVERKGNSYFDLDETCIKYRYCLCRCNGSWNCPQRYAENTCREQTGENTHRQTSETSRRENPEITTCNRCSVKDRTYPGNSSFEVRHGCIEYSDCFCRCNGSWVCPDSGARNLCQTNKKAPCTGCEVNLKRYPGNSYFSIQYGCVNFTNCLCNCNGSWSCPKSGEKKVDCRDSSHHVTGLGTENPRRSHSTSRENERIESRRGSSFTSESRRARCKVCVAHGGRFQGGSTFQVVDGCTSYKNCICRCDGTWTCPSRFATNTCEENNATSFPPTSKPQQPRQQCGTCDAKGKIVTGNTYFNLTDGCTEFRNCLCLCDGSWDCPPRYSKNICDKPRRLTERGPFGCISCNARGKTVRSGATFTLIQGCIHYTGCQCNCDGSWNCAAENGKNICLNNTRTSDNCLSCKASDGSLHPANAPFSFIQDCVEYNCDCNCDGSWKCPAKRSLWACTDRCRGCDVEGRKIESNTNFTHKTGCLEYTCQCRCNGSWSCPGKTVKNTCPKGVNVNCNKCIVSAQEKYEGETDFVLRQDCLHYKCRCNCDGSYTCPGKDVRNVCRGERIGGCKSCVVSEKEYFRGDSDFSLRKDCLSYQCRCNCDGSWECPAEDARNVCIGEVPGGCRVCKVSDTEIYRANTQFDLRKGCIQYKCTCNCNGGWKCPGKDARDVCKGEVPGGCRSCQISENEFYPGNSNFEMVKNCIHYKCRCDCNGGYSCPGRTAKRVCRNTVSQLAAQCRQCQVSGSETIEGNTTFSLKRNCHQYHDCKCNCDGSWNCPSQNAKNICSERGAQRKAEPEANQCRPCRVRKEIYPSLSTFKLKRQCYQYHCECQCNGGYTCDSQSRVNICKQERPTSVRQPSIRSRSQPSKKDVHITPVVTRSYESEQAVTFHDTKIESSQRLVDSNTDNSGKVSNTNGNQHYRPGNSEVYSRQQTRPDHRKYSTRTDLDTDAKRDTPLEYLTREGNCRACKVGDETKQTNELFEIEIGCTRHMNCLCLCSGQYECAQESNICNNNNNNQNNKHNNNGTLVDRRSPDNLGTHSVGEVNQKKEISSWVRKQGLNSTHVFLGEDGTGKDFALKLDTDYKPSNVDDFRRMSHNRNVDSPASSHSVSTSHSSSSASVSSTSFSTGSGSSRQTGACAECLADHKKYSPGTQFDMRRGCVLYKCTCLCSGSYRCAVMSDNACTQDDRRTRCSNCVYHGMVFPGGMGFKIRENCNEKTCQCHCNGTYSCPASSNLRGCRMGIPFGSLTPSSPGSVFQSNGGNFPISSGYITGNVRIEQPRAMSSSGGRHTTSVRHGSVDNRSCRSCTLEGRAHAGNSSFAIQKGCIYFDCFCHCGGSWKCAGRMSQDCIPQARTEATSATGENSGCRSCLVQETEFPAHSKFLLRQGCFEYKCSCNCDGSWVCPAQQPKNKCPPKPQRVGDGNRFEPFAINPGVASVSFTNNNGNSDQSSGHQEPSGHLQNSRLRSSRRESEDVGSAPVCKRCFLHGKHIEPLGMFVNQEGCFETICHCLCSGKASCPDNASVNVCELSDKKPMGERPGCKVGRRTHYTRVFPLVEDCHQRVCICHDNGTWTCRKSAKDKKVC